uniref:Uncharacterized protein n=1 Tax=Avena sativa TaxID=4498 RepID=A0ACD5TPT9_AVESA
MSSSSSAGNHRHERRWAGAEGETSSARSYSEVAGSASPPPPRQSTAAATSPVSAAHRAAPAGRVPAKDRIGPRSEIHRVSPAAAVDEEGFRQPRRKNQRRYEQRRERQASPPSPPRPRRNPAPEAAALLCFRYLESGHFVRDCTNKVRCRKCLESGHESWKCEQRRNERGDWERAATPPRAEAGTGHAPHHQAPAGVGAPEAAVVPRSAPRERAAPVRATAPPPERAAEERTMVPFQRPAPPPPPRVTQPPPSPPPRVIIAHSREMQDAEEVLKLALVASITGTRPRVTVGAVERLLLASFQLRDGDFTVHLHHPEDFLITFHSKTAFDRATGDHFLQDPAFTLSIRPWCKLAHANVDHLEYHVELELRGIPAQAWHLSTAEHILGASCWIEKLHEGTRTRTDLATFRLFGRAHDPKEIKPTAILEIVEQIPARNPALPPARRILTYPIKFRLISDVIDVDALDEERREHGRGGGDGAHGDRGGGHAGGQRPRRRGRKRRRGDGALRAAHATWPPTQSAGVRAASASTGWRARLDGPLNADQLRKAKRRTNRKQLPAKVWQVKAAKAPAGGPLNLTTGTAPRSKDVATSPAGSSELAGSAGGDNVPGSVPEETRAEPDRDQDPSPVCASLQSEVPGTGPDREPLSGREPEADTLSGRFDASRSPTPGNGLSVSEVPCSEDEARRTQPWEDSGKSTGSRTTGDVGAQQQQYTAGGQEAGSPPPMRILQRPTITSPSTPRPTSSIPQQPVTTSPRASEPQTRADNSQLIATTTPSRPATRFLYERRSRRRGANPVQENWTLGSFLAAATKQLNPVLPTPGKRPKKHPICFMPRRGRSATAKAPPTAERRAQVQLLRTLGIIDTDQKITDVEMKAFADVFATPISVPVLAAIAALLGHTLLEELLLSPTPSLGVPVAS